MNYFAVQSKGYETELDIAKLVIHTANDLGMTFTKIEVLDRFKLGATEFTRFRLKETVRGLLDQLHTKGRSVIGSEGPGFTARIGTRTGLAPTTTMLAAPRQILTLRGPGAQFWDRQFDAPENS